MQSIRAPLLELFSGIEIDEPANLPPCIGDHRGERHSPGQAGLSDARSAIAPAWRRPSLPGAGRLQGNAAQLSGAGASAWVGSASATKLRSLAETCQEGEGLRVETWLDAERLKIVRPPVEAGESQMRLAQSCP